MHIGIVGYRGMVGSVLLERMRQENDFNPSFDWSFFSTSQSGKNGPLGEPVKDAEDATAFRNCDVIVTCQGGGWTNEFFPLIRKSGWNKIWLDSSSALRLRSDGMIVLDPVNEGLIVYNLSNGLKIFSGGNCTVSLMLMACQGLFSYNLVEWINAATYQAASGAGAKHMLELIEQMHYISANVPLPKETLAEDLLELDRQVTYSLRHGLPMKNFGAPLAFNLIPWIDEPAENGQTREEWKGMVETNKILGVRPEEKQIPIDGLCVRIGAMRCHSQSLLIKLKESIHLDAVRAIISRANRWIKYVPNIKEDTIKFLSPAAVSGTLDIAVGRLHKACFGGKYIQLFTVGDQLLWGAAEPIRRALKIICENV